MIKKTLVFSKKAYLSLKLKQLVIKRENELTGEEEVITRPIEDIGIMMIESGQVTLTSSLVSELIQNNIGVIFCDSKHMPANMILPLEAHTLQSEKSIAQIQASLPLKKQLWQQTVSAKILNQGAVLRQVTGLNIGNMIKWASSVRSGDPENLEGRAAAYYWRNMFMESGRFRRDKDGEDDINIFLNYGYAILRAIIARSIVGSGLTPLIGIHHSNKYNANCLADDIMEPYRPYVDLLVADMVLKQNLNNGLDKEAKKTLLTIPNLDVSFGKIRRPLLVAASITTSSLAKCFSKESRKVIYPRIPI
jgi:CRISPR-associated protein Cas1